MTIYFEPFYTRAEIDAARPALSRIAGFDVAKCLSIREAFSGHQPIVIDYSDLYAWNFYEKPSLPGMLLAMKRRIK